MRVVHATGSKWIAAGGFPASEDASVRSWPMDNGLSSGSPETLSTNSQ